MSETPICISGGAPGADSQFGMCAGLAGHTVFHFIFAAHRKKVSVPEHEIVVLTQEQLDEADYSLTLANETLGRTFPSKSIYTNNLLRRNYYQVRDSERVYAVAGIEMDKGTLYGGTAWAVQMFIDRHHGGPCEVYVFDQEQDGWFTWTGAGGWVRMTEDPPTPHGVWTGIGTSKMFKDNGKAAVRRLLKYVKPDIIV